MAITCAVKLSNTIVEKATITTDDVYKALDAAHSTVKETTLIMGYTNLAPGDIGNPLITLDASDINVTSFDGDTWLDVFLNDLISSQNHSRSIFDEIIGSNSIEADPAWTLSTDDAPNYGNVLSYNVKPYVYTLFNAFTDFSNYVGYELEARFKVTSMGGATTIRATAEWQDRNSPGWIAMSPAYIDVTDTIGEYSGSFSYTIGVCGEYDYRITLIDLDAPGNTLVLTEENMQEFWCS